MEQERQDKLQALLSDQAFVSELLRKTKPEDAQAYFEENGLTLSHEEIMHMGAVLNHLIENNGELSEEELAQVAGGTDDWLAAKLTLCFGLIGIPVAAYGLLAFAGVIAFTW